MPTITFTPSNKVVDAPAGADLISIAKSVGVELNSPCGGKGTCGKCTVRIVSGEASVIDYGSLSKESVEQGYVLACKTAVFKTPLVIDVPESAGLLGGQFSDSISTLDLIDPKLFPSQTQRVSRVRQIVCQVAEPKAGDGLSDCDRLTSALFANNIPAPVDFPLSVLKKVPEILRTQDGWICAAIVSDTRCFTVIDISAGKSKKKLLGIAIDVGTTTVAVHLVELLSGSVIATHTQYNSQITCGLDVISRINYARRAGGLAELATRVRDTINSLINETAKSTNISVTDICDASVAGNTTMMHLLLGINPEYIRLDPYTPAVLDGPQYKASDLGININPDAMIYLAPAVGSYVGGDICSGILCTSMPDEPDDISLFIDIGTNGELVVGNGDFMLTCACSAGPAFEGGGIGHGMRASTGAIDRVSVDPKTGIAQIETIGNVLPKGICGSGMISLVASMFRTGWIDMAGKLDRSKNSPVISVNGRRAEYTLVSAQMSASGEPITISEVDIDNIIRTKAAIYSACALMLKHLDMAFDDLKSIYIAGGFGRFLDLDDAITIGMIPDISMGKIHYIGNSSLAGAMMTLVSQEFKSRQKTIAKKMTYIDLSTEPEYMDHYTAALFLPHTNTALFPSVKVTR